MKYLVVQDWESTHGNHAGMVHMCDMLVEKYPSEYVEICQPMSVVVVKNSSNGLISFFRRVKRVITRNYFRGIWMKEYMPYLCEMLDNLKSGDEVFLLQYCTVMSKQDMIANYIRKHYKDVRLYAMSHQTKTNYLKMGFDSVEILKWDALVDKHILMGTSLTKYFIECGIDSTKISTGFHYVDDIYYHKEPKSIVPHDRMTIIAMGAMQRDFHLLADIVNHVDSVNWIICQGKSHIENLFHGKNVKIVGYVSEEELKDLMDKSDASINVMGDTVGSNVITTSLSMGLAVIASDVGSIRDYIDSSCGILCDNTVESFVKGIKALSENPDLVMKMRKASIEKASNYTISKVNHWFGNLN